MRKDGRPLVTEHPVTAWDMIDYVEHVELPDDGLVCALYREPDPLEDAWMEEDLEPDAGDVDGWGA